MKRACDEGDNNVMKNITSPMSSRSRATTQRLPGLKLIPPLRAVEWGRLGRAIGRATHLQDVSLCGSYESRKDRVIFIYPKLRIKDLNLLNRDLRNYLTQFFTDNRVIECLHVFE
jgi:hypothetical protein